MFPDAPPLGQLARGQNGPRSAEAEGLAGGREVVDAALPEQIGRMHDDASDVGEVHFKSVVDGPVPDDR
jgi:hypothetical protein